MPYVILALCLLVLGGLCAMLCITVPIAKRVYFNQLVRETPEKWGRVCSAPGHPEQQPMWDAGLRFGEENRAQCREVSVMQADGARLFGEFYDFGADRCVIILPGRCESLCYSYYFAPPYKAAGYNVLVVDSRAHGKSDGKYNTLGRLESEDVILWMNFLRTEYHQTLFVLHAVCVGCNTALLAAVRRDCPKELAGIVAEGCYVSFRETFRRHMLYIHKPPFPVLDLCMWNIRRYAGTNVSKIAPIRLVRRLEIPILYLFGKQDAFSVPPMSRKLYAATKTPHKELVWFENGSHSHLRLHNTAQYDAAVTAFLQKEGLCEKSHEA